MSKHRSKNRFSLSKRLKSFVFAFRGILQVLTKEHNFWIQCVIAIIVVVSGFFFGISRMEWLFVVLAIGLVLSAEIFNTAIESLVDFISPDFNRKAGLIKDIAAGAVLLVAITAAVIGCLVFIPYILNYL